MSEVTTPKSRIVWGHPFKSRPVLDDRTKQPKFKKDGTTPRRSIEFGLAIPKAEFQEIYSAMYAAAAEKFPNGIPQNFAWKLKDGDTDRDSKGVALNTKEGYAGCVILTCRTELDSVPNYTFDASTQRWVATDQTKRGDYVRVTLDFSINVATSHTEKSSIFVNPKAVMLWEVGAEIKGGEFDPNAAGFAPPPPQTPPPGAPLPGGYAPPPQQPQAPAYAPPQQPQYLAPQAPAYAPPQQPQAPTAPPHTQFLQGPKPPGQ